MPKSTFLVERVIRIYLITNQVNGKRYVGQTHKLTSQRWHTHVVLALRGGGSILAKAIRKYGAGSFNVQTVYEAVNRLEAEKVERALIAQYGTWPPNGYNATSGGEKNVGFYLVPEVREKQRQGRLGKKMSEDGKRRLSEFRRGPGGKWSDESKAKASASHKGKKWTPEVRAKLEAMMATPEYKAKVSAAVKASNRKPIVYTPEIRKRISDAQKKAMTPERRAHLAQVAANMSQEQKDKIAESVRQFYRARKAIGELV